MEWPTGERRASRRVACGAPADPLVAEHVEVGGAGGPRDLRRRAEREVVQPDRPRDRLPQLLVPLAGLTTEFIDDKARATLASSRPRLSTDYSLKLSSPAVGIAWIKQ